MTLGRLARRLGVPRRSLCRWLVAGGPVASRLAAQVVVLAIHLEHPTMQYATHPPTARRSPEILRHLAVAPGMLTALEAIDRAVERTGVTRSELRGPSRRAGLVEARRLAARLAADAGARITDIARALNRSRSSVHNLLAGGAL